MRMAALSKESGVPVPTIKFYLREGLLAPGMRTSPNQSQYDETHVQRLGLIRGLTEIGGLSLAVVAEILRAIDDPEIVVHEVFDVVQRTVTRQITAQHTGVEPHYELVDEVMEQRGWQHPQNAEHRLAAATLISIMDRLRLSHTVQTLDAYAAAAATIAEADLATLSATLPRDRLVETAAAASILGDALVGTFRRMAQTALVAEQTGGSRRDALPIAE